jgi:hypothetical protein
MLQMMLEHTTGTLHAIAVKAAEDSNMMKKTTLDRVRI